MKQTLLDLTLNDEEREDQVVIIRFEQMEEIHAWNWVKISAKERVAPGTKDEFEQLMDQKAAEAIQDQKEEEDVMLAELEGSQVSPSHHNESSVRRALQSEIEEE